MVTQRVLCPNCKKWFDRSIGGRGRPRKYCTDACREERHRKEFQPQWWDSKVRRRIARGEDIHTRRKTRRG